MSDPVLPKVMTPPDLDLVNVPVGETGVSSFTAELPQQAGVEADGQEGKARFKIFSTFFSQNIFNQPEL